MGQVADLYVGKRGFPMAECRPKPLVSYWKSVSEALEKVYSEQPLEFPQGNVDLWIVSQTSPPASGILDGARGGDPGAVSR